MIRRLFIDNYKCLVNFELKLEALTLLIGPNGAGKSAVLDVLFGVRQLLAGVGKVTDAGIFPASTLTRWQRSSNRHLRWMPLWTTSGSVIAWKWSTSAKRGAPGSCWSGWMRLVGRCSSSKPGRCSFIATTIPQARGFSPTGRSRPWPASRHGRITPA